MKEKPKLIYAIPFFAILALLMGCCFVPAMHPDKSMSERRELAEFPEFSWERLASGAYFQELSTWFSDTFPGREGWLEAADMFSSLYGDAEIMISGAVTTSETVPEITDENEPLPVYVPEYTRPASLSLSTEAPTEAQTEPPTEAPTEIQTEPPTEAPTEAQTEPPTEAQTQPPTEAPTEAQTQPPTEAPTEAQTQPPTEAPTEIQTQPPTEAPTEVQTEPPTEAPAEAQTEPENGAEILRNQSAFQLDGAGYIYQNFSKDTTDKYAGLLNALAQELADTDITVVNAPPPTAVGILFDDAYQEALNSVSQRKILDYLNSRLDDRVVKVDTVAALREHKDEYIFFRTDHHWTPLGAYYAYRAICESIGLTPVELSDMEPWDLGEFRGSLTGQVSRPRELRSDDLIAYRPTGDITRWSVDKNGWKSELPLFTYWEGMAVEAKYSVFGSDAANPMVMVTNDSIPDAPVCVILKDSFGNCMVPFLTQTFHTVYVIDYRYFPGPNLMWQMDSLSPDYIISMPYITAIEDWTGPEYIKSALFG